MHTIAYSDVLSRFPNEILEKIALELLLLKRECNIKELIPLLCTNRRLYEALSFKRSNDLAARIFKVKFDVGAALRRSGPKAMRSANLNAQLHIFCDTLQDIRSGNINHPNILDIFRNAYFMASENDGKNAYQLEWAGLGGFVDRFVRERLCENAAEHNGWPDDSSVNSLALWLMWFTTTREKLLAESPQQRQEIIDKVLPFVVLPFRYPSTCTPPNHYELPLPEQFNRQFPASVQTAHGIYPLYREPHRLIEDVDHYGRNLEWSKPLITIAAKMLYFARRETIPIGIPPHLPRDRAHAIELGQTHIGPTAADVHEVNAHQSVQFVDKTEWDYHSKMSDEQLRLMDAGLWTPKLTTPSSQWDNDWNRSAFCFDPWLRIALKGVTYTHGMLNGLWQGRMLVPAEAAYLNMMVEPHPPANFGEGNPHITTVPIFMRIREHHCVSPQVPIPTGGERNGFDDGLADAWMPKIRVKENAGKCTITDGRMVTEYETFVPGKPNSHNEDTCTACAHDRALEEEAQQERQEHAAAMAAATSHSLDPVSMYEEEEEAIPPPGIDDEMEGVFESVGLGHDQNVEDDDQEMDSYSGSDEEELDDNYLSDEEEKVHRSCSGIVDLFFTGETDHNHGQAWNHYYFYGRVRRWDGLIALVRCPRNVNGMPAHFLGRWVFVGYIVGGKNFVGTWRALPRQGERVDIGLPSWESAFCVSRRDD